jgi:hypothetical protein
MHALSRGDGPAVWRPAPAIDLQCPEWTTFAVLLLVLYSNVCHRRKSVLINRFESQNYKPSCLLCAIHHHHAQYAVGKTFNISEEQTEEAAKRPLPSPFSPNTHNTRTNTNTNTNTRGNRNYYCILQQISANHILQSATLRPLAAPNEWLSQPLYYY